MNHEAMLHEVASGKVNAAGTYTWCVNDLQLVEYQLLQLDH